MAIVNAAAVAAMQDLKSNNTALMQLVVSLQGALANRATEIDAAVTASAVAFREVLAEQAATIATLQASAPVPAAPNPAGTITTATPKA